MSSNPEANASGLLDNLEDMYFLVTDSSIKIMDKLLYGNCNKKIKKNG